MGIVIRQSFKASLVNYVGVGLAYRSSNGRTYASIVFSDEGDILAGATNPDLRYNQVIRPWKSRLALLYIDNMGLVTDLRLIFLTALGALSRKMALNGVQGMVRRWGADDLLLRMTARKEPLQPYPPPGAAEVVSSYP